jgi:hypothetical protein
MLVEIRDTDQAKLTQTCAQVKCQRQSTSHENFLPAPKQLVLGTMVKEMHVMMHGLFESSD